MKRKIVAVHNHHIRHKFFEAVDKAHRVAHADEMYPHVLRLSMKCRSCGIVFYKSKYQHVGSNEACNWLY